MIDSIQKIIKVGDSLAVTIPAKDAKILGFHAGDHVRSTIDQLDEPSPQLSEEYLAFKKKYDKALKSLAGR
jgi:hypothetical protein